MIDCICNFPDNRKIETFEKSYNQLRHILHKEYFTPFDREDIYMIAVCLDSLYNAVKKYGNNNQLFNRLSPFLNKIKEIINLFDKSDKNRFRNIFKSVTQYQNLNKEDSLLFISDKENLCMNELLDMCNRTVIQIEYTILKNS